MIGLGVKRSWDFVMFSNLVISTCLGKVNYLLTNPGQAPLTGEGAGLRYDSLAW